MKLPDRIHFQRAIDRPTSIDILRDCIAPGTRVVSRKEMSASRSVAVEYIEAVRHASIAMNDMDTNGEMIGHHFKVGADFYNEKLEEAGTSLVNHKRLAKCDQLLDDLNTAVVLRHAR